MPLNVHKPSFFQSNPTLGEPQSLVSKSFLSLDTSAYLNDLTLAGNLFTQFTDEAQKFDFRYALEFDSQYAYAYTGNVSGRVTQFPSGANPADYVVEIFVYTDQAYFIEQVPVGTDWTFTTIAGTNKGNKIAHLAAVENVIETGGGGEVTSYGTVLAETYVIKPQEGYRFPRSYNVDPNHSAFEQLRYRSFGYDVAATIVALISLGEETYAAEYCEAMLKTQQRQQTDDGGAASNQTNTDRMPFSSFLHNPQFLIDAYHRTGAELWQAGAMLHFAKKYPASTELPTLTVAQLLSRTNDLLRAIYNQEYVISSGLQNGCFRGGKGQYTTELDVENNQLVYLGFTAAYSVPWCANEHNVDAYFALKDAAANASFPDLWNALKRSSANAWRSAGVDKASAGNQTIQFQVKDLTHTVMMAISETASATTLNDLTAAALGMSVQVDASGNIQVSENGAALVDTTKNAVVGDIIALEYTAATDDYRVYQNGTLIHTSTYTNANAQNIHFGSFHQNAEMHKIQYFADLLANYDYDRTYPVTSFTAIHADFSQDITDDLRTSVQAALQSSTQFYDSVEGRGRRGISDDSTLDECHALDNMTWYALARYAMGDTTEPDACVSYVTDGADGTYSTYDGFYSAIGVVPYVPNNGCYTTPLASALMWTEGHAGYIMSKVAKGGVDATEAVTLWKEIAKISRIDGIPYVTRKDNIYELQDWGCLIAAAWAQIANKPNGWWEQSYSQLVS